MRVQEVGSCYAETLALAVFSILLLGIVALKLLNIQHSEKIFVM